MFRIKDEVVCSLKCNNHLLWSLVRYGNWMGYKCLGLNVYRSHAHYVVVKVELREGGSNYPSPSHVVMSHSSTHQIQDSSYKNKQFFIDFLKLISQELTGQSGNPNPPANERHTNKHKIVQFKNPPNSRNQNTITPIDKPHRHKQLDFVDVLVQLRTAVWASVSLLIVASAPLPLQPRLLSRLFGVPHLPCQC